MKRSAAPVSISAPRAERLEDRVLFATFTVTNALDSGAGSLRQTLLSANSNGGLDTINFSIGSGTQTISPLSALPTVTDAVVIDGTAPAAFSTQVVQLSGASAPAGTNGLKVTAGGSTIRNLVINRFPNNGIEFETGGNNVVEGCRIGTDTAGNTDLGNADDGIDLNNSSNNRIGGTTAAQRNVISGNNSDGIDVSAGSSGNVIQGNYIGIRAGGTIALPNTNHGVRIAGATNTVGGTGGSSVRNVISGNAGDGVRIVGAAATGNLIQGNYLGLNPAGTAAIPNGTGGSGGHGVTLFTTSGNTVGGTATGAGNVISGNADNGVQIDGTGGTASNNLVQGNLIGTNPAGTAAIANGNDGVAVVNAASNTVGGTAAGARNVISGNGDDGIELNGAAATGNVVAGNYIGTNASGAAALGNNSDGIEIEGAINNTIGGTTVAARNVISANLSDGIELWSGTGGTSGVPTGNALQGNFIGTDGSGTAPLGNAQFGVSIRDGTGNTIGGTATGAGNVIANNGASADGGGGVSVEAGNRNAIRRNSIHANAAGLVGSGLGIDLGTSGITPNDPLDADSGANDLQNRPVPTAASSVGGNVTVQGTFASAGSSVYTLDVYASPTADPSGSGEGRDYLGSANVTTSAGGSASFFATLPVSVAVGSVVTLTATDALGNTSEFSVAVTVTSAPVIQSVTINDGNAQRSKVNSITVTFNQPVALDGGALSVVGRAGAGAGTVTAVNPLADARTFVLSFSGPPVLGGSLADGVYDLTVTGSKVHAGTLSGPTMTANQAYAFHRLFGDADGDGDTDGADLLALRSALNATSAQASYRWWWDYDADGDVGDDDAFQVRSRRTVAFKSY